MDASEENLKPVLDEEQMALIAHLNRLSKYWRAVEKQKNAAERATRRKQRAARKRNRRGW